MGRLCIRRSVEKAIRVHGGSSDNEVIGLLLGRVQHGVVVVKGSWRGKRPGSRVRVRLDGNMLAGALEDMGKRSESKSDVAIVGWYHTHPGHGVYLSPTDLKTQGVLNQFSHHVVAAVFDPRLGEMGYFVTGSKGRPIRLKDEHIHRFGGRDREIPDRFYLEHPTRFCPRCRSMIRSLQETGGSQPLFRCAHCGLQTREPMEARCPECKGRLVHAKKYYTGYCRRCKKPVLPPDDWWIEMKREETADEKKKEKRTRKVRKRSEPIDRRCRDMDRSNPGDSEADKPGGSETGNREGHPAGDGANGSCNRVGRVGK